MWKHCKQNTGTGTVKLILSPIKSMLICAVIKRKTFYMQSFKNTKKIL